MDLKKKIEGAYSPDKDGRKERVVIALSGGIDSLVAAYLLKIQRYELFAVTVQPGWDQFQGDKSQVLSCHISEDRLETIKEFCHNLKIPLHVIKSASDFQETVVEEWMAAKLTGTISNACWTCHEMRMRLLHSKMIELDAKFLATGHYAKLFHHSAHDTYYVHTSNDEENDQSSLLNRLPPFILSALMLPLSDLQKKEVKKLAENFGLEIKEGKLKMHECFPNNDKTVGYLASRVPKSMTVPGEMYSVDGSEMYGEHKGIIGHTYGEEAKLELSKDHVFFSQYNMKEHKIVLSHEDHFMHDRIHLVDCEFSEEVSWIEPMKGVIRLPQDNYVDCWIYPKAQKSAFIEMEARHMVKAGEILPVLRKKGKNSKVYLTGKVRFLPAPIVDEDLGEREGDLTSQNSQNLDYGKDF